MIIMIVRYCVSIDGFRNINESIYFITRIISKNPEIFLSMKKILQCNQFAINLFILKLGHCFRRNYCNTSNPQLDE